MIGFTVRPNEYTPKVIIVGKVLSGVKFHTRLGLDFLILFAILGKLRRQRLHARARTSPHMWNILPAARCSIRFRLYPDG